MAKNRFVKKRIYEQVRRKAVIAILLVIIVTLPTVWLAGYYSGRAQSGSTPIFEHPAGDYSYLIWKDGSTYYAKNGESGTIDSGTDASTMINNAITSANSSGGGTIFLRASTTEYSLTAPILMKENIRLQGEIDSKVGQPSVQLKAHSSFTGNAMVYTEFSSLTDANSPSALTQSPELFDLTLNGDGNVNTGVNFTNVDSARLERVRISGVSTGIAIEYFGVLPIPASGSTYNGFFIEKCVITATNTSIYAEYATQSWIINSWFVGGANRHIDLLSCVKVRILGNELNSFQVSGINLADTSNDEMTEIEIMANWIYTTYNAKYFTMNLGNNAATKRIKIDNNMLVYTGATRPNKTDFPDGIPASSFSDNSGTNSFSNRHGNATILNGNDAVTVTHELLRITGVVLTSGNGTRTGDVWAISFDTATFIIKSENVVSADTVVYWYAWAYP